LHELRRRVDLPQAKVLLARALLAQELDGSWKALLTAAARRSEEQQGMERLALARELAAESLAARPSSWEAATILGACLYLEGVRGSSPELMARIERWEGPLLLAHQLAPNEPEPPRFLASAYLSQWSRLPAEKREVAKEILATALRDTASFDLLLEPWLRLAPSQEMALDLLPDAPSTWNRVQTFYRKRLDFERFANANRRWFESISVAAGERLAAGRRYRRGGDDKKSMEAFRWVLQLTPERTLVPHFEAAVMEMRPHKVSKDVQRSLRRWLNWALPQCALVDCPLEPLVFDLLSRLLDDLETPEMSSLHLLSGHRGLASLHENRSARRGSERWSLYYLLKAKSEAKRRDVAVAEDAYLAIAGPLTESLAYRLLGRELAALGAKRLAAGFEDRELERLEGSFRPASGWRETTAGVLLEAFLAEGARELWLQVDAVVEPGAVLEVQLQGQRVAVVPVSAGDRIRLELDLEPGAQLLEVRPLTGRLPNVAAST
jgi:hypothetical protein